MSYDKEGRHRAIYWTKCSERQFDAFEYGPYWVDQQTKQVLTQINEKYDTPSTPDYSSREALARMAILESPQRARTLDQLISDSWDRKERPQDANLRQGWALRVARFNPTDRTVEFLRRRLDRDEVVAMGVEIADGQPLPSTHPGYCHAARDDYYDEALLTYVALGRQPNATETLRLRYYGYLGDPKERLEALLAEDMIEGR
jgi:hypothetical protein